MMGQGDVLQDYLDVSPHHPLQSLPKLRATRSSKLTFYGHLKDVLIYAFDHAAGVHGLSPPIRRELQHLWVLDEMDEQTIASQGRGIWEKRGLSDGT
jgi:hypothetical protein